MATNKHAVIRYQALDKCFSNFGRRFYIDDLIEACNNAIYEFSGIEDGIKRRQLFEDIKFMESDAGYSIELDKLGDGKKKYYRYTDKNFSINKQPLSQIEAEQLKDTIMMLNRFKGLPQFDWMEEVLARFEDTFKLKANVDSVVSFEQNPYLRGIEHFTVLFNAVINKQVLKIEYKASFGESQYYEIHPYFLKQYNNRWFLFGISQREEQNKLMNMAIDRIVGFEPMPHMMYIDNKEIDFTEYFDDVIGVTVPNDITYWDGVEAFEKLKIGLKLRFEREMDNKYDPKAVAIYFEEYKLGYIPRANNSEIAKLCEQGYANIFDVRINRISADEHTESQIGVVVHIINNSEFQNK